MRLNFYDINEQSTTTPILILHGLFGSSQNWQTFARQLSRSDFRVISVDLRNHGRSFHHKIHTYEAMAFDLLCLIKENLTEPVNILGHSMGGKVAMLFSSLYPEYVNKLAIIDIAPVKYLHSQIDKVEALLRADISKCSKRSEVEAIIRKDFPDQRERAFFMLNLIRKNERFTWKINLEALQSHMDDIMNFPKVDTEFNKPTLFVAGSESDYMSATHQKKIHKIFPNYKLDIIKNSGHWVHIDKPIELQLTIENFF